MAETEMKKLVRSQPFVVNKNMGSPLAISPEEFTRHNADGLPVGVYGGVRGIANCKLQITPPILPRMLCCNTSNILCLSSVNIYVHLHSGDQYGW